MSLDTKRTVEFISSMALNFILFSFLFTITDLAIMGVGLFSAPAVHFVIW
jgi:Zn-dependent membrane protease YugP